MTDERGVDKGFASRTNKRQREIISSCVKVFVLLYTVVFFSVASRAPVFGQCISFVVVT